MEENRALYRTNVKSTGCVLSNSLYVGRVLLHPLRRASYTNSGFLEMEGSSMTKDSGIDPMLLAAAPVPAKENKTLMSSFHSSNDWNSRAAVTPRSLQSLIMARTRLRQVDASSIARTSLSSPAHCCFNPRNTSLFHSTASPTMRFTIFSASIFRASQESTPLVDVISFA